jgi:hypothetical protein
VGDSTQKLGEASAKAEKAMEEQLAPVVGSEAFAQLLAEAMGTSMGLIKLSNDAWEGLLRAARFPTQGELTRLGRQLVRLDDKLEDLLVAIERIEDRLEALEHRPASAAPARRPRKTAS